MFEAGFAADRRMMDEIGHLNWKLGKAVKILSLNGIP
jgi:hypothetical protein